MKTTALSCLLFLLSLTVACAGGDPTIDTDRGVDLSDTDERRGPLGKGDAFGSCEASSCDGQADDGNCWCDEACEYFGDCCGDKAAVCDETAPVFCGGIAGQLCAEGTYCLYDEISGCGFADGGGTCAVKPEACIELFAPVCGCDGETYGNSCKAAQAGVTVAKDGPCDVIVQSDSCEGSCGGKAGDCWCDEACESFGDCCDDVFSQCAAP